MVEVAPQISGRASLAKMAGRSKRYLLIDEHGCPTEQSSRALKFLNLCEGCVTKRIIHALVANYYG